MDKIWSMFHMLQLVGNLKNIESIRLSPSVSKLIEVLESATNFKIFQIPIVKQWLNKLFKAIKDFESIFIALTFFNFLLILAFCFLCSLHKTLTKKFPKFLKYTKEKLFWNGVIRPKILMYYPICITIFSEI